MRLINVDSLVITGAPSFRDFAEHEIPTYAILSHRWGDAEVTLQELTDPASFFNATSKSGYQKIRQAAIQAQDYSCQWLWSDTCCIDKTSSAELSEAINSMYKWYQCSHLCFAYLADVPASSVTHLTHKPRSELHEVPAEEIRAFAKSVWFERAWTLQELIAPSKLIFFDASWRMIRNKQQLAEPIAKRTRIDKDVLLGKKLDKYSVAQKMSWAADRKASRTEDIAYSLLGIFDVNMPMLYGEGKRAFIRLQEEIMLRNADQSIFVWTSDTPTTSILASCPKDFKDCSDMQQQKQKKKAFGINNLGLVIELTLQPSGLNTYVAHLPVESGGPNFFASLKLVIDQESGYLCRIGSSLQTSDERVGPQLSRTRKLTILRSASTRYQRNSEPLFGFHLLSERESVQLANDWDPLNQWDLGKWTIGNSRHHFVYKTAEGPSASIAMFKWTIGQNTLLIQLAYDFDFNPCCNISKYSDNLAFLDRFRRLHADADEKVFGWTDTEADWSFNIRHQETKITDPATQQNAWIAKSINRQEFSAVIPPNFTSFRSETGMQLYTNVEIKFSSYSSRPCNSMDIDSLSRGQPNKEWQFELDTNDAIPQDLCRVGDVEIVSIRTENEQETLRRLNTFDNAGFQRHSKHKEHPQDPRVKMLKNLHMNRRTDTSPT